MAYASLKKCVDDLERNKHLVRIDVPIDPHLEAAAIHRRVFEAGGPAILFTNVVGCKFPMVSNLFGTIERSRYLFRHELAVFEQLVDLKIDPMAALRHPLKYASVPLAALRMLPRLVSNGPVMANKTTVSQLPQMVSWPRDGGPFVTLPQVYTEDVREPGLKRSNLGMYRIQLGGNEYVPNDEIGLHYQIHRSIGVHQQMAVERGEPFRVNIFVGGPPAMSLAAVMPLPEGMSELGFAGVLGGSRVRMVRRSDGLPVHADTDFAICGTVIPGELKPEGPFGDHLGYYSLAHPFPVLKVEQVYHRDGAIWPFTVVGRPPQEDTMFGQLIHELTSRLIPAVLPGVKQVHAVDAAGVHPLLLAIGSERYTPYRKVDRPQELLTQASAILGQGQLSLAKFLWIAASQDDPQLDLHDIERFFAHMLSRADWNRDLHFTTETTIDTLDYSGSNLNSGSKLVVAAVGERQFDLATELPSDLRLPDGFSQPEIVMPGVLAVKAPPCPAPSFHQPPAEFDSTQDLRRFCESYSPYESIHRFRLVLLVDDSQFVAKSLSNFLWVTFTRTNPASDVDGIGAFIQHKHWGCQGPLVMDARTKPHHVPALAEDPDITRKVDSLAAKGGPLAGLY
ncbi:UbiD family decarboxylase [Aeoliella mucimassa]|uniref:4-hydroxybenzoate decarboxylase subunit C n=1 Tax=Aeoliella mucimassa TaxID=2527972 RepID=A0A518AU02_9BACT|nr:UbiD family decarboxylase [Aeoliella mucimassa]QDU58214.1 4-hydroxybenzoate decarboxylase subunit C [Aeoliella mucimassa]